ncbi:MAG: hypothetical protein JWO64_3198 [Hyphomicrobiales bacterium]|jgi:hypothetical protein|nr:hypothetical protein [Hyphomicrobiales bacterium]
MRNEDLAPVAGDLNQAPATAERTARLAPLVVETNTLVRAAADELVTLDSTPLSFQSLKADFEPAA